MTRQPALFISHGSPMILIEDSPARRFLAELGCTLDRPAAIVSVSAHWLTARPAVSAAPQPETVHDFGGFPPELYQLTYPAPGDPALAAKVLELLRAAEIAADAVLDAGFDHGTWVPLRLMYPDASVPVVQVSVQPRADAAWHHALGRALVPLRDENVLIVGSGAMTHNLRAFFNGPYAEPPGWTVDFLDWMHTAIRENRRDDLVAAEARAPHLRMNHPTPEHLLPFFVALGAGEPDVPGRIIHRSLDSAILAMDAVRFD